MAACAACGTENPAGSRFCNACAAPLTAAVGQREQRKTVTVVFCDVVGSTALGESTDPEAVRAILARYFELMKAIVERHGGTVEKFIGDAVVAVFGVPVVHEDDALRALRAAMEMRDALPGLQIEGRLGVNTGEIITNGHGTIATGDAMNVAARLQQAANPGEILVGQETRALAGEAVDAEQLRPLVLKGKQDPVAAFRLLLVHEAPGRRHGSPFVGRKTELGLLRDVWARAVERSSCALVTIVGEPGVGKSRLAAELAAGLDVQVVQGRCLSYGEGITYFPLVEVITQLGVRPAEPAAAATIASLLGETDAATSPEAIAWAFRKLLESSAPLVVIFDDIQWGEETFLDLVEDVALLSSGAPLLLLCLARPELGERRPRWPVALLLEPLPPVDVEALLPAALPVTLRERIAHAASGNPLFVTEMVAMTADPDHDVVVPATLKALLAARLDQLEVAERGVLERGAVEGEVFHRGAVEALSGGDPGLTAPFATLVRKGLIRPERAEFEGEDGFRFRHLLIRDAAYNAIPKATRADLHERYAGWVEGRGSGLDAFIGYHLEQAYRCRVDLRDDGPETAGLARRASERLERAATVALGRGDLAAAAGLLERAARLPQIPDVRRGRLLADLGATLIAKGDLADAERALDDAQALAGSCDDAYVEARVLVERQFLEEHRASVGATDRVREIVERVIPIFERSHDQYGLCRAWHLAAYSEWTLGHVSAAVSAWERATGYASASGADHERAVMLSWLASCTFAGPMPADQGVRRCEEIALEVRGHPAAEAEVLRPLAGLHAYLGRFDLARDLLARRRAALEDIGSGLQYVVTQTEGVVEMLAGDFAAAEKLLRDGYEILERLGENALRSTTAAQLARAVLAQGRDREAEQWCETGEQLAEPNDLLTHIVCRGVRAGVLVAQGRLAEAEAAAREGVALAATTDLISANADAHVSLAAVLDAAGRAADASAAGEDAVRLYEQKGNLVAAAAVRERLDRLAPT